MTGLCGWALAGRPLPAPEARAALGGMSRPLDRAGGEATSLFSGNSACFVRSWRSVRRAVETEGLLAAIDGAPLWTDVRLAKIARESGHPAALVEAYRLFGDGFLSSLKGSFSVAVVDHGRRRLLLAVDRMGIGRLYHARTADGGLAFGTSADAVAAHPGVAATLSEQGIFDYLFFYMSPAPSTIYREQSKLLAGEMLIADADGVRTERYWRMPYREIASGTEAALEERLRTLLGESVARCVANEPPDRIGAFLSGGLDSSTMTGLLCRESGAGVRAFTIGFDSEGFDEMPYAAAAAQHFGADHVAYYIRSDDLMDAVPRLADGYDEPFGNSSAVPTWCCAREARARGVDVMIAGDGGDELFAGNDRYRHFGIFERYNALPAILRNGLVGPAVSALSGMGVTRLAARAQNFLRLAAMPMPDRTFAHHVLVATPLQDIFESDFLSAIDPDAPVAGIRALYQDCESSSMVQRMMAVDLQRTLADNDLLKVGRASEMAGIEVRYPFLDDDLVEFSAGIPGSLLMQGGELRGFYKHCFRDFLPPGTLTKQKHGFGLPTVEWMRLDPRMNDIVMDAMSGFGKRGYVRKAFIELVAKNLAPDGSPYISNSAWDIMMLELWLQSRGFAA